METCLDVKVCRVRLPSDQVCVLVIVQRTKWLKMRRSFGATVRGSIDTHVPLITTSGGTRYCLENSILYV